MLPLPWLDILARYDLFSVRSNKYLRLKNYLKEAGTPLCACVSRFELYVVEWLAAQALGWCDWLIDKFDVKRLRGHSFETSFV